MSFEAFDYVEVHGLSEQPELNGSIGKIAKKLDTGRYAVSIPTGNTAVLKSIRPENLNGRFSTILPDPTKPLTALGNGGDSTVHIDGPYGSVPRPPFKELPQLRPKIPRKVPASIKKSYLDIFHGSTEMHHSIQFVPSTQRTPWSLTVRFFVSVPEKQNVLEVTFHLTTQGVFGNEMSTEYSKFDSDFWGSDDLLPELLKAELVRRVLHLGVRSSGVAFNTQTGNAIRVGAKVCRHLRTQYEELNRHKEILDIDMIRADLLIQAPEGTVDMFEVGQAIYHVGESLEAVGRHIEAAELYMQAARDYYKTEEEINKGLCNAGLAYKRGEQFSKAEEHYIEALHLDFKMRNTETWDSSSLDSVTIQNLMQLYGDWCAKLSTTNVASRSASEIEMETIWFTVVRVLFFAGNDRYFDLDGVQEHHIMILQKFRSKNAAQKVLSSALAIPSVKRFRAEIRACLPTDPSGRGEPTILRRPDAPEFRSPTLRETKTSAREQRSRDTCVMPDRCASCNVVGIGFRFCPCRMVQYW